jgi:nucleoid DNA-binding protein
MLTIRDLAEVLVQKHQLDSRSAETFLNVVIETIHEGLKNDRVVKVKGFGTFKLTAVRERESINVNTGERVVISSHDKVSFTPDAVLRDLVNKPFAQFDTVVLADGVDFEDMPEVDTEDGDAAADETVEIPAPVQEQAKVVAMQVEQKPEPIPEPVVEPVSEPEPTPEPVVEEPVVEEVAVEEPVVEETVVEEPAVEEPVVEKPVIEEPVIEQPQPEEPETTVAPENVEPPVAPVVSEEPVAPENPVVPEVPEIPEIPETPEVPEAPESPAPEEEQQEEAQEEQPDYISEFYDDEENADCKKMFLIYAIIVNVIVAALFFVFGYYARSTNLLGIEKETAVETPAPAVEQPETTTPKAAETATPAKTEEKEAAVEQKEESKPEEQKPVAEPKKEEKTEAKAESTSKYDSDPRVRTGAYRIVGVANTVTVKSGQTIKSISKTYLGAGMECYVEAFNGGITELKEGQTIKIPKLELKKKGSKAKK